MTSFLKPVLIAGALSLSAGAFTLQASHAQDTTIAPIDLPDIGTVPDAPDGATVSHDSYTIEKLMVLVEVTRLVAGGIEQIFASTKSMTSLLGAIRDTANAQLDAITGDKPITLFNGEAAAGARKGGESPREMADEGLGGSVTGSDDIVTAYARYSEAYGLEKAFEYQGSDTLAEQTIAFMAANGAVAAATAEHAYKRANDSMERLDTYITELAASADLKTSLDINTRVNIEVAQQLNELIRNQAAQTTLAGMHFMGAAGVHADMKDNFDLSRLKDLFP
ncbi:type IV secretion system protein [Breoghania sp. JC706]|uniref:type IV secretion system protein n=1 Tax=Breoghania sp. JC706 TaxID=3117732 RepID=UPI00300B2CE1